MKRLTLFDFIMFIIFLLVMANYCNAQTTYIWLTFVRTPPANPVLRFTEFGNGINVEILDNATSPKVYAKTYIAKSSLMKTTTVRDTIKVNQPVYSDPTASQQYKDLQQKYTDANQMLAQEINLVNVYQQENDKLHADNALLIDEVKRLRADAAKDSVITIKIRKKP